MLVVLSVCAPAAAQRSKPRKPPAKVVPPAAATPAVVMAVPFRAGESLEYRVLYSKYAVNAARIETSVLEQRNFFGRMAWHFRASARTLDTTRLLFPLDDQFDSYASVSNIASLQYELYLHEQGKQQSSLYRMTTDSEPAPDDVTAFRVAPGTLDAVGFLYLLRAADWQKKPELRATVFDGRRLYETIARMDMPQGTATVPAGTISASRIAIRLFDRGKELSDTHLWLWIAQNSARTPVLIEAEVPIGTCRIELMRLP
jgi:Protein of unknown function (DUF3108)